MNFICLALAALTTVAQLKEAYLNGEVRRTFDLTGTVALPCDSSYGSILVRDTTGAILLYGEGTHEPPAYAAGARGAILKSADLAELRKAIADVAAGRRFVSAEIEQIMTDDPPLPTLSPRQGEILDAIARGLSNAEIARQLDISLPMVKEHLSALFQKLNVANRAEAVAIALRKRLLTM